MPEEEQERTITNPSCSDGRMTKSIENLRKLMDGQKKFADTWTTSRRSTSATAQPGTSGTGTKTPSSWYPMMMIAKLDWCEREPSLLHCQFLGIWQSLWRSFLESLYVDATQIRKNGIAERAERRVKEGTSAVPLQSGLDNEWWADSMECYTYLRNIQDPLSDGKSPCERRFGMPFNGTVIPFGSMVEYHPISAKDLWRLHQFGGKVLPGRFLGCALVAGRIWKGDFCCWHWGAGKKDASEIHARRLSAKEVLTTRKGEMFIFCFADGTAKLCGKDHEVRESRTNL